MPCSTLSLDVGLTRTAEISPSGCLMRGDTPQQCLQNQSPKERSLKERGVGDLDLHERALATSDALLPDVNGSRPEFGSLLRVPNADPCCHLHSSSSRRCEPGSDYSPAPDAACGNKTKNRSRRKKAKCREKTRNRRKKIKPPSTSEEDARVSKNDVHSFKSSPKQRRAIGETGRIREQPDAGKIALPGTPADNGDSSAPSGGSSSKAERLEFGGSSAVRLPRISANRGNNAISGSSEVALKKCASNPEIASKEGGAENGADKKRKRNNTPCINQVNNRETKSCQQNEKKQPQVALLVAIKPENQDAEREKFFKQRYNYNPQFKYRYPTNPEVLERYSHPTSNLLPVAEKIMRHAISKYGSFEKFVETTGGKKLNRSQIVDSAKKYLKREGLLDEVSVRLSDDILSRACMTRFRGQPTLQVRINEIRELWMEGLLRHELGTHYIRSSNNRNQEWYKWRRRREMNLRPFNPTEEGIAALHSIISRPEPSLFRSALLYYTAFKASEMSFSQLFKDLAKFVKDPHVRWDYCMRAKRGQTDTSEPGTFSKDQVYLTGALSILKHRSQIDFHALFRCGKVDFRDVDRLKEVADLQNTRIPGFMADLRQYRRSLDEIVIRNGLTDDDLAAAA